MDRISLLSAVKHSEIFCRLCGGHLISMIFPPRSWEGYNASLTAGWKLCLLIGLRTLPLLKSRHNNPLVFTHCDLQVFPCVL
jgi:hypothetical protein